MKKLILPLIAVVCVIGCQESKKNSITKTATADSIVGGEAVASDNPLSHRVIHLQITSDNYDSASQRMLRSRETCTASALTRRILITAAHCAQTFGTITATFAKDDGTLMGIQVVGGVVHKHYDEQNDWADIALMTLASDLPESFELMNLPQENEDLKLTTITAAGFGRTDGRYTSGASSSGTLQTAELNVIDYKRTDSVMVVDQSQGKGGCLGDSGGPATITKDGKTYVVGVFSKVKPQKSVDLTADPDADICAYKGYYVSVQFHMPWIQKMLAKMQAQ